MDEQEKRMDVPAVPHVVERCREAARKLPAYQPPRQKDIGNAVTALGEAAREIERLRAFIDHLPARPRGFDLNCGRECPMTADETVEPISVEELERIRPGDWDWLRYETKQHLLAAARAYHAQQAEIAALRKKLFDVNSHLENAVNAADSWLFNEPRQAEMDVVTEARKATTAIRQEQFRCRCGVAATIAPADGGYAVCENCCEDHDYQYERGDGHRCIHCFAERPADWGNCDDH